MDNDDDELREGRDTGELVVNRFPLRYIIVVITLSRWPRRKQLRVLLIHILYYRWWLWAGLFVDYIVESINYTLNSTRYNQFSQHLNDTDNVQLGYCGCGMKNLL